MIDQTLFKTIQDVGLSENEAKVYVSSLSLGPTTVQKIAQASEVKRTTVYSVIDSLKEKGLMNIEIKGFKNLYVAESPERLDSVIENRREFLALQMPELMAMYNLKGGESAIKYYEGLEAVKNVYEGLIRDVRTHDKYYIISDMAKWHKLDPEYFEDFLKRRAKLNIDVRALFQDYPKENQFMGRYKRNYNVRFKLLPKNTDLTTNMVVTPQRVVIHQLTPPILAIVIENKSVIKMHQEFFEIMWQSIGEK